MGIFHKTIEGKQTWAHQLRVLCQVLKIALKWIQYGEDDDLFHS